jgi:DNA polymerase-3 subunit delta'
VVTTSPIVVGPDGQLPLPWLAEPLARAVAQRGHALLLHGGEGRGLFELAMTTAQALLCSRLVDGHRPCGTCDDCHLVQSQVHPDLNVLVPAALRPVLGWRAEADDDEGEAKESKAKPSQDIRIAELRAAIDWGTLSVARDRVKVLVIHPATRMNPITANALLKTLEEPPGKLQLVLTARSPRALLPTIASRCQHLRIAPPERETALAWLAAQGVNDADALLRAAGEPLLARDLATQGIDAAAWQRVPVAVRRGDGSVFAGWPLPAVVDALCKLCHDAMCVGAGDEARYFDTKSVPRGASWAALRAWSIDLSTAASQAAHPWHALLAVDALVFRASRVWAGDKP